MNTCADTIDPAGTAPILPLCHLYCSDLVESHQEQSLKNAVCVRCLKIDQCRDPVDPEAVGWG